MRMIPGFQMIEESLLAATLNLRSTLRQFAAGRAWMTAPGISIRVKAFLHRYALPAVKPRLVVPCHQVALRAQPQSLYRQFFHFDIDWFHRGAAFWTILVPQHGAQNVTSGVVIVRRHGTNPPLVILVGSLSRAAVVNSHCTRGTLLLRLVSSHTWLGL